MDPVKDGVNWYVYAGNNPLRFIDPSGLAEIAFFKLLEMRRKYDELRRNPIIVMGNLGSKYKRKFFIEVAKFFAGRKYSGKGSKGYDRYWRNKSEALVCTSYAESVLRVTEADNYNEMLRNDKNLGNATAIFEGFDLEKTINENRNDNVFTPSELENLDKTKVYGLAIYRKDFIKDYYQEDNEQHIIKDEDELYGTYHVAFLYYDDETTEWKIAHKDVGENLEDFEGHKYANDDIYRMKVYTVNPDENPVNNENPEEN